jgi:ABC-type polysaccharide/polyol phosphate transport system ATPase subunit
MTTPEPVIRLRGVGKRYDLVRSAGSAFTRYVVSRLHSHMTREDFWALRGVDLEVPRGSRVNIIGDNGSGKSTLLKLIGGITEPTEGTVEVHGRVVAMLEVGLGFHPDLTGYENIYLHGALLGLSHSDIDARVDAIIDYAELGEFMELPLKHFSTGMHARLGFAVAVHSDPDIVLVDEVLAVGDGRFQLKCIESMRAFHEQGKTILLVTHNIRHARSLCDRILWLDHGRIVAAGPAEEVALLYRRTLCHEALGEVHEEGESLTADEERRVHLADVALTDAEGRPRERFRFGEPMLVTVHGVAEQPIEEPDLRFTLVRDDYEIVGVETARGHGCAPARLAGEFTWTIRWPGLVLNTAAYDLGLTLLSGGHVVARKSRAARFWVEARHMLDPQALADLPCAFELIR